MRIENTQTVKDLMLQAVTAELENLPEVGETLDARVLAAEGAAARIKTAGGLVLAARLEGSAMLTAGETVTLTVDEARDGLIVFRLNSGSDADAPDDKLQLTATPDETDTNTFIRAYSDKPARAPAQPQEPPATAPDAPANTAAPTENAPKPAPNVVNTPPESPTEPREPAPAQNSPPPAQGEHFNPPVAVQSYATDNIRAATTENIPQPNDAQLLSENETVVAPAPDIAVEDRNAAPKSPQFYSVTPDDSPEVTEQRAVTVRNNAQIEDSTIPTDENADDLQPTPERRAADGTDVPPKLPDETPEPAVTHSQPRERVRAELQRPAEDTARVQNRITSDDAEAVRSTPRNAESAPAQPQIVNEIRPQNAQENQPPQTAFAQIKLPVELRGEKREAEIFVRRGRRNRDGSSDNTDMLLSLDLPAMGKWDAAVTVTGRELTIRMKTESEPARELLVKNAEQLSALVELTGFHITSSRVSVRGEGSPLPEAAKPARRGRAVDLSI
ncbi:MAG: flagellar hook-length control protein FliK [Oscillospiraceae bacterium]|nr:flagellar hook-length control protein FliK [Oscillospiraceae bacterium]